MAKTCMFNREEKRLKVAKRDADKRSKIKAAILVADDLSDKMTLSQQLAKLDRNGSESRQRNRCSLTGRPRAFYNRFGICRNMLRDMASKGMLPGVRKASW
jgi:small subunit ribosomal protein S14